MNGESLSENSIWNPEIAYAVGLIVADGSLSKDGRHIDFTSKDLALVKLFQQCLEKEHCKIGTKQSGSSNSTYYRLQFGDKKFYDWLISIGIKANKSKSVAEISIPELYFFDFLRGVFDGDGTIYVSRDKRWRSAETKVMGFASGSMDFLIWLQKNLKVSLHTTGFITNGSRVLQLRYGKSDATKIARAMYVEATSPRLERKFAKIQKILRIVEPS